MLYVKHSTSTALVEKNAKFLVSNGLSLVNSGVRLCGSDSPVSDELSTCHMYTAIAVSGHITGPSTDIIGDKQACEHSDSAQFASSCW